MENTQTPFIQLHTESTKADAITYLEQLARSPFAYHLDDSSELEDGFHWGNGAPDAKTLQTMSLNISLIWRMHEEGTFDWDEVWDIYGMAWTAAEAQA